MSRTWKLLGGREYVEKTNIRKQIKKNLTKNVHPKEQEAIDLFKYWNKKGDPFTKGRMNSKISCQGLKLCEKALERYSFEKIKQSINNYHKFLSHPHTTLGPGNPISPTTFRDFFEVNKRHYIRHKALFLKNCPEGFTQWVTFAMDPGNVIFFFTKKYYETYSLNGEEDKFFGAFKNRLADLNNFYAQLNSRETECIARAAKLMKKYSIEFKNYFLQEKSYGDWVATLFDAIVDAGMDITPELLGSEFPYKNLLRRYLYDRGYK